MLVLSAFLLLGVIIAFTSYIYQQNESANALATFCLKAALVDSAVIGGIACLRHQEYVLTYIRSLQAQMAAKPSLLASAGQAMAEKED